MFQPHEVSRTIFDDRRSRFEQAAGRRRLLHTLRHHVSRSTTADDAVGAARQPITLGRTPSVIARRAA